MAKQSKEAVVGNIIRFKYRKDASIELTGLVVAVNPNTVAVDITQSENFDRSSKMHERQIVKHGYYEIVSNTNDYENIKTMKGTDFFKSGEVTTLKQDKMNGLTVCIYHELIAEGWTNDAIQKKYNLNNVVYYDWKKEMGLTRKTGNKPKQQADSLVDEPAKVEEKAVTDTSDVPDVSNDKQPNFTHYEQAKEGIKNFDWQANYSSDNENDSDKQPTGLTTEQAIQAYQTIEKQYAQLANNYKKIEEANLTLTEEVKKLARQAEVAHEMYQMQKQALVESEAMRKAAEAKCKEFELIANDAQITLERQDLELHHFARSYEATPVEVQETLNEPLRAFTAYEEIMFRRYLALMDTV